MQHIIRVLSVNTAYLQIIAVYLCFAFTYLEGVLQSDNGKRALGFPKRVTHIEVLSN